MTRFLSSALGAEQPLFGQSIMELERASGRPGADIRLSSEIMQKVRLKLTQLGLDPDDTTSQELYAALLSRLSQDEQKTRIALQVDDNTDTDEILGRVQTFLQSHTKKGNCFALKSAVAKRMLKKKAPKNAMKLLGYRSLDSMLKHESVESIYAAALITEPASWHRTFRDQYGALGPGDFEQRPIHIIFPKSKRWEEAARHFVETKRHNIICFKELGSILILPMSARVDGIVLTTLLLALHTMNDIRAYSSFAKLQQVKPMFGTIIRTTVDADPMTTATLAGQTVPWKVIQRYYGKMQDAYHPEVFEPHVQPDDLQWHDGEKILAELNPALAFWIDTQYVSMVRGGEPVSCNILDVALSFCNKLSFADRIVHFAREHLWHELMSRYLHQENLEIAVHQQLSMDLIDNQALAEL